MNETTQAIDEFRTFRLGFWTMIAVSARPTNAFVPQAMATITSQMLPWRNSGP